MWGGFRLGRVQGQVGVDVAKAVEISVMTYVAQFLKACPETEEDPAVSLGLRLGVGWSEVPYLFGYKTGVSPL